MIPQMKIEGFEEIFTRLKVRATHGEDEQAKRLIRCLFLAMVLMKTKDFWTYLYDWLKDVSKLFKTL